MVLDVLTAHTRNMSTQMTNASVSSVARLLMEVVVHTAPLVSIAMATVATSVFGVVRHRLEVDVHIVQLKRMKNEYEMAG